MIRLAIVWSIIGLFSLLVIASFSEPKEVKIIHLGDNIGKTVLISGEVTSVNYKENVNFINLKDNSAEILVVAFGDINQELRTGNIISVVGKVEIYSSELEIIAKEINCLKCMN